MIEKFLKVIDVNEPICINFFKYNSQQYVEEDVYEENGIPQPEGNISSSTVIMDSKKYNPELLRTKIKKGLEEDIIEEILNTSDTIRGEQIVLPYLLQKGQMDIYNSTKKFIPNIVVVNPINKNKIDACKEIICSDLIPENIYLLVVKNDMSYAAIVAKNEEKYTFDLINPDLIKVIKVVK